MASIEDAIYSRTVAYSAVTTLSADVYRGHAPQDATLPYIVISRVSTQRHPSMGGYSAGLANSRFQLDCFAATDAASASLADAVRNCWGGLGRTTIGAETVEAVFIEQERVFALSPEFSGEEGIHRRIVELEVWYGESVPSL